MDEAFSSWNDAQGLARRAARTTLVWMESGVRRRYLPGLLAGGPTRKGRRAADRLHLGDDAVSFETPEIADGSMMPVVRLPNLRFLEIANGYPIEEFAELAAANPDALTGGLRSIWWTAPEAAGRARTVGAPRAAALNADESLGVPAPSATRRTP
jgi:hypothetical protein